MSLLEEDCLVLVPVLDGDDDVLGVPNGILRGKGEGPPLSEDSLVDVDVDVLLPALLLASLRAIVNR